MVVDAVLQDALEERAELFRRAIAIAFRQFHHGVLNHVEGGVFVPQRKKRLLEGASLDAGEKV
ncbi:hypothetical protein GCM10025771_23970 [Niveibacterium umoris]